MRNPTRLGCLLLILLLLMFPLGNVSANSTVPYHVDSSLEAKKNSIKTLVLIPPRIEHFEISAGGVVEKMHDWTTQANGNLLEALSKDLNGRGGLIVSSLPESSLASDLEATLEETHALYTAVNYSILVHTYSPYSPNAFPAKINRFDYSLGSEIHQLAPEADAFLLVQGFDRRSTGGRQALQIGSMVLGALVGVVPIPQGGGNEVSVALVEGKTGTILWYYRMQVAHDLRNREGVAMFMEEFLRDFPFH